MSSATNEPGLKEVLRELIPVKRERVQKLKREHASKTIGQVQIGQVLGGMRGLTSMLWDGSTLDADEGIRFHGKTIGDCARELPKGHSGDVMLPEAMFWLLLTGQVPSTGQIRSFSRELAQQAMLPEHIARIFPTLKELHPMAQLSIMTSALSSTSKFAAAYTAGLDKRDYWETTFDDAISLLAKLPLLAGMIFRGKYGAAAQGHGPAFDPEQDMAWNMANYMGRGSEADVDFQDVLRLYLALHGDHEGGNVSAHATHLVGSALSDPFLSYSAGLQGLAGPLHGLAAQDVLRWILAMQQKVGVEPSDQEVRDYLWQTLRAGQVIPGYGHGVLRKTDPRFVALVDFAQARPAIANDPVFKLVLKNSRIAPEVLKEHGKTKNPYPNVDSASGVLFHHYGLKDFNFYTVIFGVSRGMGPLAQLIWDRALGLPIERPKSIDLGGLEALAKQQ